MKILHICQRDDPDTGGSLRVAEALVREQRRAGIDAAILFLYGEPAKVFESFAPASHCLGLNSSREAFYGIFALRRALHRIAPDIIHSHDGIIWPRLALFNIGIPLVMHSHLPLVGSAGSDGLKARIGHHLIKSSTTSLIGISLHTIETWTAEKYPPSKIHYVPNGVDFDRFTPFGAAEKTDLRERLGLPLDKHILLWVGRIHREMKGADRVERISALLPENMVLVVVGNGPDFGSMQRNCEKQITDGRMIMVGSTSKPEDYYQAADEFIFTSHHEPFGLVLLEAVAAGLPLLAFPVTQGGGAVKLLVEFEASMFADDDSDEQIQGRLAEIQQRASCAEENRNKALNRYSWRAVSGLTEEVYSIVLNRNL